MKAGEKRIKQNLLLMANIRRNDIKQHYAAPVNTLPGKMNCQPKPDALPASAAANQYIGLLISTGWQANWIETSARVAQLLHLPVENEPTGRSWYRHQDRR
jgi:hypothetical protein